MRPSNPHAAFNHAKAVRSITPDDQLKDTRPFAIKETTEHVTSDQSSGPLVNTYQYEPLSTDAAQIRLLRLLRTEDEEDIHCFMHHVELDSAPQYAAISYAWGDEINCKTIHINGKLLLVRYNCWNALSQVRHHHETLRDLEHSGKYPVIHGQDGEPMRSSIEYVWIDSICVRKPMSQHLLRLRVILTY